MPSLNAVRPAILNRQISVAVSVALVAMGLWVFKSGLIHRFVPEEHSYWVSLCTVLLVISTGISAGFAVASWMRRPAPGAAVASLMMVCAAIWSAGTVLEIVAPDISTKLFWVKVEYLGIAPISLLWLVFTSLYLGEDRWITAGSIGLLSIVPLVTIGLIWTMDYHSLVYTGAWLETSGPFPVLALSHGPLSRAYSVYVYSLFLVGVGICIRALAKTHPYHRGLILAVLASGLVPFATNIVYLLRLGPIPYLDLTPFAFAISGMLLTWGLTKKGLHDIIPVARNIVFEAMSDSVIVVDSKGRILDANLAAQALWGGDSNKIIGRLLDESRIRLSDGTGHSEYVTPMNGRWYDLQVTPIEDRGGRVLARVAVARDITDRYIMEQRLNHMAFHDALTEVSNRNFLYDRLPVFLIEADRAGHMIAVMLLDLDGFKAVNDSMGHTAGDRLLREIAHRLARAIRASDLIVRWGGDEFVIVLPDIRSIEDAALSAQRAIESVRSPMHIDDRVVTTTTSMGLSVYPLHGDSLSTLLRSADMALYRAKMEGKNRYCFYDPAMEDALIEKPRTR